MIATLKITAVPDHLRGYISRFLVEYGTGLYVGNVSKRVADALWARTVEAAGDGEVVLVTSTAKNEQGFRVQLYQGRCKAVVDLDGYELLRNVPEKAYKEKDRFL